jgi:predicted PurR-regulated permease PerM
MENMINNPTNHSLRNVVLAIVLIMLGITLWYIREILQPLIMAGLFAYLLSPIVHQVMRWTKLKRKPAANIVFFIGLALIITLLVTVIPGAVNEARMMIQNINASLDSYQQTLITPFEINGITVYLGGVIPAVRATISQTMLLPKTEQALQILQSTSRGFLWFLMIVVTTYNLMTEWDKLRDWLIGLAPERYHDDAWRLYIEIKNIWLGYLGGQVRLMLILAVIYSLAWSLIGLPGAIFIGALAGFLNLVPEVGPGATALIAMLVALLQGSNFLPITNGWFALLTGGVYLILNNFKSIYLQPRILGKSVFLHEGVVFVALITAIILQGMLGVLIVVPVLASAMIVGRYLRRKLLGLPAFDAPLPQEADAM